MSTQHAKSLAIAKDYFRFWEVQTADDLRGLLDDKVMIVIPMAPEPEKSPEPWVVYDGIEKSMGYLEFAMSNLPQLRLVNQEWSVSEDAQYVHLHAQGDMINKLGNAYKNVYVFRLQIVDGRIVRVDEYANPSVYVAQGL